MTTLILSENNIPQETDKLLETFSTTWPFTQTVTCEDATLLYTHCPSLDDISNNIPVFHIYEYQGQYVCGVSNFIGNAYTLSKTIILESTIGQHVDITIMGLNNNQPIKSKVDTGAACCSLNAKNIKLTDSTVEFEYGNSKYKFNLSGHQQIETADNGVEERPVITVTCKLGNEVIKNVQVNLNDRTGLDDFLAGVNLLKHTNSTIDPKLEGLISQCLALLSS
jgi:hypothetical protein